MVDVRKSPADRLILILLPASGMEPTGRAESFEAAAALTPVQRRGPLGGVKVMTIDPEQRFLIVPLDRQSRLLALTVVR
jgi:hypothetical protein